MNSAFKPHRRREGDRQCSRAGEVDRQGQYKDRLRSPTAGGKLIDSIEQGGEGRHDQTSKPAAGEKGEDGCSDTRTMTDFEAPQRAGRVTDFEAPQRAGSLLTASSKEGKADTTRLRNPQRARRVKMAGGKSDRLRSPTAGGKLIDSIEQGGEGRHDQTSKPAAGEKGEDGCSDTRTMTDFEAPQRAGRVTVGVQTQGQRQTSRPHSGREE
ncbi:hypothetical protein C8R47DRAFT_1071653 [Mycena vitilis]|nr:hypothetical protein C8R47DRAFT_1071653 [Mycena vitilis]